MNLYTHLILGSIHDRNLIQILKSGENLVGINAEIFVLSGPGLERPTSDEVRLTETLHRMSRFFAPMGGAVATRNLRLLREQLVSMDWLGRYLSKIFAASSLANESLMNNWKLHLRSTGCDNMIELIDALKASMFAESSRLAVSEVDIKVENNLKRLQESGHTSSEVPLTAIRFTGEISQKMGDVFGMRYDIEDILIQDREELLVARYEIHRAVFEACSLIIKKTNKSKKNANPIVSIKQDWSMTQLRKITKAEVGKIAAAIRGTSETALEFKVKCNAYLSDTLKLPNFIQELQKMLLSSEDFERCARLSERNTRRTRNQLSPWQHAMVKAIENGDSILVSGPTSGGKTYASMAAMETLTRETSPQFKSRQGGLLYVAPNSYQALQAYCNIIKTLNRPVALIIGSINTIPNTERWRNQLNSRIWVGTPVEINAYLKIRNEPISIGIFDEIHTISTNYALANSDGTHTQAMSQLMNYCSQQIIALSATIHPQDLQLLAMFIHQHAPRAVETMLGLRYFNRPVPVNRKIFRQGKLQNLTTSTATTSKIDYDLSRFNWELQPADFEATLEDCSTLEPETPLQASLLFNLLVELRGRDLLPALIFDENDTVCYTSFREFIEYLEAEVSKHYTAWVKLAEFNPEIQDLNSATEINRERRAELRSRIVLAFEAAITAINPELPQAVQIRHDFEQELDNFKRISRINESLALVCLQIPSFLSFRPEGLKSSFDLAKILDYTSLKATKEQMLIQSLCDAESIHLEDVESILQLMARGMKFGVGVVLPSMPFAAQYYMLQMLKDELLTIVFASQAMSMGINFPIRTSIIRQLHVTNLNVCQLLQMEGRAGRKRDLDKEAVSVLWNVANYNASESNMPRIRFPEKESATLIANHTVTLTGLYRIHLITPSETALEAARKALDQQSRRFEKQIEFVENSKIEVDSDPEIESESEDDSEIVVENSIEHETEELSSFSADLSRLIVGCTQEVGLGLGMHCDLIGQIAERVQLLANGLDNPLLKELPYTFTEHINRIKFGLQELHIVALGRDVPELRKLLAKCFELFHRVGFRQLRFGSK